MLVLGVRNGEREGGALAATATPHPTPSELTSHPTLLRHGPPAGFGAQDLFAHNCSPLHALLKSSLPPSQPFAPVAGYLLFFASSALMMQSCSGVLRLEATVVPEALKNSFPAKVLRIALAGLLLDHLSLTFVVSELILLGACAGHVGDVLSVGRLGSRGSALGLLLAIVCLKPRGEYSGPGS